MRSECIRLSSRSDLLEPEWPHPTPFPIRIIQDPPFSNGEEVVGDMTSQGTTDGKKRSDYFYEAWNKFLAQGPAREKAISTIARKTAQEQADVVRAGGEGLQVEENASKSWEQAAQDCRAKVEAIVKECERLNEKYRDHQFNLEAGEDTLKSLGDQYPAAVAKIQAPPWIKRVPDIFDDPQFFIDGASATDIHQGSSGDCWFLAALMAISAKKELIDRLCVARNERAGVYGFVFYRDGEWINEVIDDKLYIRVGDDDKVNVVRDWNKENKEGMALQHDSDKLKATLQRGCEALYFSHCKSDETWLPLIEKAYAKAHGDYYAIEGGWPSEAIEDLTGGVGICINPEDIMDKDRFWREQLSQVNKKYLFGGASHSSAAKGFVSNHAYAVLEAFEEGDLRLLKLRNPWGKTEWTGDWSDGSKLWTAEMMIKLNHMFGDDGIFWIPYADFLKHFPSINRVRLFDSEWQIAQQWTSVNVPWTVDYLDTKFQFTIDKQSPVVLVLNQPDDRYWYNIRGRYWYAMHFRVVKEGDEDTEWIVRSMHNSGGETVFARSVSAEIEDLKPGTYKVLIKLIATRTTSGSTAEEWILKLATGRKEKLLHVGRRYDYAQTKGNLRGLEEANKREAKREAREKDLTDRRRMRKHNKKIKEKERLRKQRVDQGTRKRKNDFETARAGRVREREKKINEERAVRAKKAESEQSSHTQSEESEKKTPPSEEEIDPRGKTPATAAREPTDLPKESSIIEIESGSSTDSRSPNPVSPLKPNSSNDEDDNAYESPIEPTDELDDNDFDWDSDLDRPVESETDEEATKRYSAKGKDNEIFEADPWNAMCVLGLRVYAKGADAKVKVIRGRNFS